jgi:hypothetical protein
MAVSWIEELEILRRRTEALRTAGAMPDPLRRQAGEASFARLRATARTLFDATIAAYRGLCPRGYPVIDDNGIAGTGGAVGIRFSEHHSFFFALERATPPKKKETVDEIRSRQAAQESAPRKRMPGDPLPPPNPEEPVRLAMIALRYDERSGWAEVHRTLDPRWDEQLLREHLSAYLVGVAYDVTVGARALE